MGTGRHIDELAPMPVSPVGSVVRRHGIYFHVNMSPCFDGAEFLGYPIAWIHQGWRKIDEGYDFRIDCMYRLWRRVWLFADYVYLPQYFRPLISMLAWNDFAGQRDTMWASLEENMVR